MTGTQTSVENVSIRHWESQWVCYVLWKAFVTPLIFSCTLAGIALLIGLTRHYFESWKRLKHGTQRNHVVEDLIIENDDGQRREDVGHNSVETEGNEIDID